MLFAGEFDSDEAVAVEASVSADSPSGFFVSSLSDIFDVYDVFRYFSFVFDEKKM